jgi:hypothetical protein
VAAVTTDRAWSTPGGGIGVEIRLIRQSGFS